MGNRRRASKSSSFGLMRKLIPVVLIFVIIGAFGAMGYFGYRAVVASSFFKIKSELIEVNGLPDSEEGIERRKEIIRIVEKLIREESEATDARKQSFLLGLESIAQIIDGLPYVKKASVSRKMPDGLRISVIQRERAAVFRIEGQDVWFDDDGERLDLVKAGDPNAPFVMRGWNSAGTPQANEDNRKRIELYRELKTEWTQNDLVGKVSEVDATDLRNLRVTVTGGEGPSVVIIGNGDFVNKLRFGIETKVGYEARTGPVQSVDVTTDSPVVVPRAKSK